MDGYGPHTYGESFADVYDDWYADVSDVEATVAGIAALADGGPVLELGVGTGRLAIPLAATGLAVTGIDASPTMLERLRAKPGGSAVTPVHADMADAAVAGGGFAVAFAAFNTFFNLTDNDAQERCVAALAESVRIGGRVVIEAFVPPAEGMAGGGVSLRTIGPRHVVLSVSDHDGDAQRIRGRHIEISPERAVIRPWQVRYRSPSQLDELFAAHGFTCERRTADWSGTPFTAEADVHVTVYRRP